MLRVRGLKLRDQFHIVLLQLANQSLQLTNSKKKSNFKNSKQLLTIRTCVTVTDYSNTVIVKRFK